MEPNFDQKNWIFFEAYRKLGFGLTLRILSGYPNGETPEVNLRKQFKKRKSSQSEYYRVREDLLKFGLIAYGPREDIDDKKVFITEKGRELLKLIDEIEDLLTSDPGSVGME